MVEDSVAIALPCGRTAIVDAQDADRVRARPWHAKESHGRIYAVSQQGGVRVRLHRFIIDAPHGTIVDHINGDGLDCRRANLRHATTRENACNGGPRSNNTTGFRGVSRDIRRSTRPFRAFVHVTEATGRERKISLGCFDTAEEAARAYDAAAREMYGEFARPNFPTTIG